MPGRGFGGGRNVRLQLRGRDELRLLFRFRVVIRNFRIIGIGERQGVKEERREKEAPALVSESIAKWPLDRCEMFEIEAEARYPAYGCEIGIERRAHEWRNSESMPEARSTAWP